nr:MAG TPA: Starch-binding associating with outer membrane [Bacteriophage sp.]
MAEYINAEISLRVFFLHSYFYTFLCCCCDFLFGCHSNE